MTKSLFNLENISELSDLSPSLTCLPLSPVSLSHLSPSLTCLSFSVSVVKSSDGSVVSTFDLPKTSLLDFSPLNTVVVTWQPYSSKTPDDIIIMSDQMLCSLCSPCVLLVFFLCSPCVLLVFFLCSPCVLPVFSLCSTCVTWWCIWFVQ